MEAPSPLRTSTWKLKAVQEANLAAESQSKSPSWRSHGLLKRVLGASWAQLGPNLGALGPSLGALGANLGALGANLGAIWAASGPSWALLGPTWAHFELHGPSKASLGLLLEALGRVLEAPRSCLGGPKRSQQLNSEAQSPPRSQFWRPRALSDAKLTTRCLP